MYVRTCSGAWRQQGLFMNSSVPNREKATGFTLIELMVVVAIVAILAAIAIPSYTDYVTRGKLTEAHNGLSAYRVSMEQYYQDNRAYVDTAGACGVATASSSYKYFNLACVPATTGGGYTATMSGRGSAGPTIAAFSFSITDTNVRATPTVAAGWGSAPVTNCWVVRKGGGCQ